MPADLTRRRLSAADDWRGDRPARGPENLALGGFSVFRRHHVHPLRRLRAGNQASFREVLAKARLKACFQVHDQVVGVRGRPTRDQCSVTPARSRVSWARARWVVDAVVTDQRLRAAQADRSLKSCKPLRMRKASARLFSTTKEKVEPGPL